MNTITLTLDETTAEWAHRYAAKLNVSVTQFIENVVREKMICTQEYEDAMRRFFAVKPVNISDGKPYPKREELYDRKVLR